MWPASKQRDLLRKNLYLIQNYDYSKQFDMQDKYVKHALNSIYRFIFAPCLYTI